MTFDAGEAEDSVQSTGKTVVGSIPLSASAFVKNHFDKVTPNWDMRVGPGLYGPGLNVDPSYTVPDLDLSKLKLTPAAQPGKHASSFLEDAVSTMKQRAAQRDASGSGERSMERTVNIFNAWTGNKLTVQDGWRFMIALKQAREIQGNFHEDDYVDLAAYAGLLGEDRSLHRKVS